MIYKCGLVGLGRIGCGFDDKHNLKIVNTHAGAYKVIKNARLVAICDIDKAKLEKYGDKYDVDSRYLDYNEMFKEELNCVSICTLADSHLEIVKSAVKNGIKGIFLEKPISNSLKNASEIIEVCEKNKVKLQIDHQRRFIPFYQEVRKKIANEEFGKIQQCIFHYGAGIANTGSHVFDLIRMFFGDIEWVEATLSNNSSNNPKDPNLDARVGCKNQTICHVLSYNLNNFGISEVDILGENSRLTINLYNATAKFFVKPLRSYGILYTELKSKAYKNKKRTDGIVLGLENLLNCIENNEEPLCTGFDGYRSLEGIIAARISTQKNGKRINCPIRSHNYIIDSM